MFATAPIAGVPLAAQNRAGASFDYAITGATGAYATTFTAASILYGLTMRAQSGGFYVLTQPIDILRKYGTPPTDLSLQVDASAALQSNRRLAGSVAAYNVVGTNATATFGYLCTGAPGRYASASTMIGGVARTLARQPGAYGIAGTKPRLTIAYRVAGTTATYALVPSNGQLDLIVGFVGTPARMSVQGFPAALRRNRRVAGQTATYGFIGRPAAALVVRQTLGLTGRFEIAAAEIAAARSRAQQFAPGSYVVIARTGTLAWRHREEAVSGHAQVQPFTVTAAIGRKLAGSAGQYRATGYAAQLGHVRGVTAANVMGIFGQPAILAMQRVMLSTPMIIEVLAAPINASYSGDSPTTEDGLSPRFKVQSDLEPVTIAEGDLSQ